MRIGQKVVSKTDGRTGTIVRTIPIKNSDKKLVVVETDMGFTSCYYPEEVAPVATSWGDLVNPETSKGRKFLLGLWVSLLAFFWIVFEVFQ